MRRKIISILAATMMLATMPTFAFASQDEQYEGDAAQDEAVVQEEEAVDELSDEASGAAEEAEFESEAIPDEVTAEDEGAVETAATSPITLTQQKNKTTVTVHVGNLNTLKKKKKGNALRIVFKMKNGKKIAVKRTHKKKLSAIDAATKDWQIKLPQYGKYSVTVDLMKNSRKVKTLTTKTLKVIADEYNILQLRASTPVLVTTLKFLGDESYTTMESGDKIPTIIYLGRDKQYNWKALPAGWYREPYESTTSGTAAAREKALYSYVRMLKSISPKAKFHFYINDYHLDMFTDTVYKNKFRPDQYTITMVTDGSASYAWFKKTYENEENAQEKHDNMVADFLAFKKAIYAGKKYTLKYGDDPKKPLRSYAYALLDAENQEGAPTDWWVVRKSGDTFGIKDKTFQAVVTGDARITSNYINNLLAKVKAGSNEPVFKKLYNFDDSQIKDAIKDGKKPMMILGSAQSVETANPINPYVRFTMSYYGNEYAYFYKGHPGYITEDYPERVLEMTSLGMKILESSIAAELFQYYNEDLYMSGYQSSTFQNAGSEKNDCGLYNIGKKAALDNSALTYAKDMDFFMTRMTTVTDEAILGLVPDSSHDNYLVEFSDAIMESSGNDIAIWDADDAMIYYYKSEDGSYVKTSEEKGAEDVRLTMPKKQAITSLKPAKKALTVKWKKDSNANGYVIQVARNKSFTKQKKTYTVKTNSKTAYKAAKLKAKKKYYVRVCSYVKVPFTGDKVYAAWSNVKAVKTK